MRSRAFPIELKYRISVFLYIHCVKKITYLSHLSSLYSSKMIMSVREPISRKRNITDSIQEVKRPRTELEETFSDTMYSVYVKSAMEALEMVC